MNAADYINAAERFADISRNLIRQEINNPRQVEVKSDATPVTPIDKKVERALRSVIEQEFPTHGIQGEEYDSTRLDSDFIWVLDPIDGTMAFIAGLPVFGTLIALTWRGSPILGVLDSPITQERWIGVDGHGTKLNGQLIQSRPCPNLSDAFASTSSPLYFDGVKADQEAYHRIKNQVRWIIYGGGCHTFGRIAHGYVDLAFEAAHDIFDYMALVPIISNAGGCITDWNGNPLTLQSGQRFIASGDSRVHDQALELLVNSNEVQALT